MIDRLIYLIEKWSAALNLWAYRKKMKPISQAEWTKGYRAWKKRKCPHN